MTGHATIVIGAGVLIVGFLLTGSIAPADEESEVVQGIVDLCGASATGAPPCAIDYECDDTDCDCTLVCIPILNFCMDND